LIDMKSRTIFYLLSFYISINNMIHVMTMSNYTKYIFEVIYEKINLYYSNYIMIFLNPKLI